MTVLSDEVFSGAQAATRDRSRSHRGAGTDNNRGKHRVPRSVEAHTPKPNRLGGQF